LVSFLKWGDRSPSDQQDVNRRVFPDAVEPALYNAGHTLQPETVSEAGVVFHTFAIEAIERYGKVTEKFNLGFKN
jgi:hypothetical protein